MSFPKKSAFGQLDDWAESAGRGSEDEPHEERRTSQDRRVVSVDRSRLEELDDMLVLVASRITTPGVEDDLETFATIEDARRLVGEYL